MISYNPHRIDRALLARACDYIEEAVYLLEASLPAEYHRRIDERDIAITAVALVLYRVEDWHSILDQFLTELADELGFFPERC
jgi:hypothetical protein